MNDFHVIVPARYGSERFPGKILAELAGRPIIAHVQAAAAAAGARSVFVATDDDRIAMAVEAAGGQPVMTGDHPSGSDRIAAAARELRLPDDAILVNLQGDEPLMPPAAIGQVAALLAGAPAEGGAMATLAVPLADPREFHDPNVVKVVVDADDRALYFSRSPIPHPRGEGDAVPSAALRHVGLYAYRNRFLQELTARPPAPLEEIERLEQLRALHLGARILVGRFSGTIPGGVDTPEDLARAEALLAERGSVVRILFVCMGNICRSPTAQGVAEAMIARRGLAGRVEVDSAGTHAYHVGDAPDPRSCRAGARRGYDLTTQRARRVEEGDFRRFDYVLAMDAQNLEALGALQPAKGRARVARILDFSTLGIADDVPDPYYGGGHGFEQVLDLLEDAVGALLDRITRDEHG